MHVNETRKALNHTPAIPETYLKKIKKHFTNANEMDSFARGMETFITSTYVLSIPL
jgi:hypothetical protein